MAIFEQRNEKKLILDETQELKILIESTQKINGHIEYILKIQRGPFPDNTWRILRRYNDFDQLNKCLQISKVELKFPGKKIIGNMRPEFIAERLIALQEYLNQILMNPILASSLPTKKFIDPDTYTQSFHDVALQYASMCLRTDSIYTLGLSLGPIGWRIRKHYFRVILKPQTTTTKHHLIKSSSQSHGKQHSTQICVTTSTEKEYSSVTASAKDSSASSSSTGSTGSGADKDKDELILCWTEFGPDKHIDEKEIHNVLKNFAGVQHPFILPIEYIAANDYGALVIRKFFKQGSLRDLLCGVKSPVNPFLSKYGSPKGRSSLPLKELALYGRQILEALKYLYSKGMAHGHVHCGNVIIVDSVARLIDVENFIFGVPSFYRPFFVKHPKISTSEAIDVYGFGHLMYEMSMGYPLQDSYAEQITDCPDSLKSLLESILLKESCKAGLPTLEQLTNHQFFKEYAGCFNEVYAKIMSGSAMKPHLKFSTNAKEQLKNQIQKTEARLRDEQKLTKNQKRLTKVQELMSSEEERKKSKHRTKLEHKQSKLRTQNSLQLNNGQQLQQQQHLASTSTVARSDSANSISDGNVISPPGYSNDSVTSPPSAPPLPTIIPPLPTVTMTTTTTIDQISKANESISNTKDSCSSSSTSTSNNNRSALLDSICNFNKTNLKKINLNE
uniref:PX domain-containing protein kinase-like protein n=1 Tax=Corethrella appendiculata TaxID=1370023 RepID=U5EPX8_9DIPT